MLLFLLEVALFKLESLVFQVKVGVALFDLESLGFIYTSFIIVFERQLMNKNYL